MCAEQVGYKCTIMRGGTSRALFFLQKDLPPKGPERDYVLQRAMGKPDKFEIDGIGGGQLGTSKIAIIGPPSIPDADIDYTFGQVLIDHQGIDYQGNCGNISSAVGPFAIEAGLVKPIMPETTLRIHNTNTKSIILARVPTDGGRARIKGDYAIAGIPGTGAEIALDFRHTVGAKTGKLLPTGKVSEEIHLESEESVEVSICDAGNPCVFVRAEQIGFSGKELPPEINKNTMVLKVISEIKDKTAERIGLVSDWRAADPKSFLPFVAVVAKSADHTTSNGEQVSASAIDFLSRLVILNLCHPAYAGTGAICTAACASIPESVPNKLLRSPTEIVRIGHPQGVMPVRSVLMKTQKGAGYEFSFLGFSRTARKIMDGQVYVPSAD
jgi:2-methylaconitate cis-trans-isomerase PrpF